MTTASVPGECIAPGRRSATLVGVLAVATTKQLLCQHEVSVLVEWPADNGAPDDVDPYGVATGTSPARPNDPPSAWLEREGFAVPVPADDGLMRCDP